MVTFDYYQHAAVEAVLVDMAGRVIASQTVEAQNGENVFRMNHASIAAGIYHVHLNDGQSETYKKLFVR